MEIKGLLDPGLMELVYGISITLTSIPKAGMTSDLAAYSKSPYNEQVMLAQCAHGYTSPGEGGNVCIPVTEVRKRGLIRIHPLPHAWL